MSETSLRWKGRLGSLKPAAAVVLLLAVVFLAVSIGSLSEATNNPTVPQAGAIGELVNGAIGANRYVTVSGTALYPAAYEETEDGRTVAEYYYLLDGASGHMILIKAATTVPSAQTEEPATITGMTRGAESELQKLVESDLSDIRSAGLDTRSTLYVADGQKPPDAAQNTVLVAGLSVLSLLCLATFFAPSTVFGAKPVDTAAASLAVGDPGVKASGRFQKLAGVHPSIEIGKGTRKFNNGVANVIPLEDRRLMVYIHHILTQRVYGIKVREQETHWGVFVDRGTVIDVEPGMVYGWHDRPAVRIRYGDETSKQRTLIVSFNHAGAQADVVSLLRQMGFAVGSGEMPLV